VRAVDDVCLELHPGELLALVGENGAGKSSLMNVLYGLYRPDSGELHIDGKLAHLSGPADAIRQGIRMVHQHFMLVPDLTVAQNVVLGREPTSRGLFDEAAAKRCVQDTAERFGFRIDPAAKVEDLSVGSQQKVEIIKALHGGARVLILDEPTAVLTPQEADELFGVTRKLAALGHTVVFISHKLREVLAVADRIAVMRAGRLVAQVRAAQTSREELAEWMVGSQAAARARAHDAEPRAGTAPPARTQGLLQVEGLAALRPDGSIALRGVSLEVHPGEIVGIAGVDGNGQRELAEALTGLLRPSAGSVLLDGRDVTFASPGKLRALGVGHIPEDRHLRAMVGAMSVEENLDLTTRERGLFIDFAARRRLASRQIQAWDIRPADPTARMGALSGGNQQKVVVARELDASLRLLVVVQPTRGLDIAASAQVHQALGAARRRGAAVLLLSLDLSELLALCDRIYALYDGGVTGQLGREAFDERTLGRLMLGAVSAHA
jgi:general nucleoside transport system ATP-binding protein